jgi:acetoin utilization deacetylase AcuC-like enzyme
VELVRRVCEQGGGYLNGDTPVSRGSYEAALYAAGAVLDACELARSERVRAFCLVRPPGHHAGVHGIALSAPTRGFCVFNNIAIGARFLLGEGFERILLIDHDCHHGNGTEEILYSEARVLKVDIHQDPRTIYPGTGYVEEIGEGPGRGYMVNVPLPPGSGDDIYGEVLGEVLLPLAKQFKPELVLVSAGFDSHREEPITGLALSAHGFSAFYDAILEVSEKYCDGKVVATLEGGYGPYFGKLVTLAISKLAGEGYGVEDEKTKSSMRALEEARRGLKRLKEVLSPYWSL